jgi:VWFA-related protein
MRPFAIVGALWLAVAAGTPGWPESATRTPAPLPQERPLYSSGADLVVVHATVTDRRGTYVTGLPPAAFRLDEDGVPQEIQLFSGEDAPATIGLLVDSSGSMREARDRVIAAAAGFAAASHGRDELFALAFGEDVRPALPVSSPFTTDASELRDALTHMLAAYGRTAMYDAISRGLAYVREGTHPRRVLVIIGDGGDNASRRTFDDVLREAQASNAAIYAVGVIDPLEHDTDPGLLRQLARATGGAAHFPRRVRDVAPALQRIARDIHHSYTLGYVSTNGERDGRYRRIRVRVVDPAGRTLVVRSRTGYLAGRPAGK